MNKQSSYKIVQIVGLLSILVASPVLSQGQTVPPGSDVFVEDPTRVYSNMPGGKFTVNTVDMRIKIANGYFTWSRTYDGNGWRFSPHLAQLRFEGPRAPLGMGSGGGGSSGGGSATAPMQSAPVQETFGYVGAFVAYEPDPHLVPVPLASIDQVIRNGTVFEADEKYHFYQQKGSTSGRYFVESTFIQDRGVFYRWQDRAGDWILFDAKTGVDSYGNANGLTASMEYEDGPTIDGRKGKRLKAVKDRNGNVVLTFVYDQAHPTALREVREVLLPGENFTPRVVKYDYDFSYETSGARLLTSVTDAAGNPTSFGYDDTYRLTSITDGEGHVSRVEYQGKSSRKVKEIAADLTETTFAYSYDKTKKQYMVRSNLPSTAAGTRVMEDIYDADGVQIRQEINGQLSGTFSKDGRESISLNSVGRQIKRTQNEFELVTRIDFPDSSTESMEYSPSSLQMTKFVDTAGTVSTLQYDEKGNLVEYVQAVNTSAQRTATYVVDAYGLPIIATLHGRTESNGTTTPDSVWKFEYDERGSLRKSTDPEGFVQRYLVRPDEMIAEYVDARNNSTITDFDGKGRPLAVRAPLGQTYLYTYDKVGNLITQTDPLGRTIRLTYDALGRVVQASDAKNGAVKYEYDSAGSRTRVTDADGQTVSFEHDSFDRLIKTVDGMGQATKYRYDTAAGADQPANNVQGINWFPTEVTFPTFTKHVERDAAERIIRTTAIYDTKNGGRQASTIKEYDRRSLVTRVIEEGRKIGYTYDALSRPIEAKDAEDKVTKSSLDIRGNLIELTDADGRVTKFEYDRNNRRVKEMLPLGQAEFYQYDEVGNLKTTIDRNKLRTDYTYDALNRVTQAITTKEDGTKVASTKFAWNLDDTLLSFSDTDHIRNLVNEAVFTYDELGRRIGTTVTYPNGEKLNFGYGYSAGGSKIRLTWPDGTPITYSYSSNGALETVSIPNEGNIQFSTYKWDGPTDIVFPGGVRQQRQYDGNMNLEGLKVTVPQQQSAIELTYEYNLRQEVTSSIRTDISTNGILTRKSAFEFDALGRLTKAKKSGGGFFSETTQSFGYDGLGNRVSDSLIIGSWAYDKNSRLEKRGATTGSSQYEYDDAGNLIGRAEGGSRTSYAYDSRNRLIAVNGPNGELIARYGYDPMDRRIWREQFRDKDLISLPKAKRTLYLYGDEGLIAEAEQEIMLSNGVVTAVEPITITTQYGPRPNGTFTTKMLFVKTKGSDGKDVFAYFQHDRLGVPLSAFNKAGTLVWSADYDVYGRAVITTPSDSPEPTIIHTLRLPGQIEDPETGWHYNWHRYYDPETGRYVTNDPIGLAGGINRYAYANANPINGWDPLGLATVYIWNYRNTGNVGHASMALNDGTYISWWPAGDDANWDNSVEGTNVENLRRDIRNEKRPPDQIIIVNGLDEDAIRRWWDEFKKPGKNKYAFAGQNCAKTIAQAIDAGGGSSKAAGSLGGRPLPPIWTPSDVGTYTKRIKNPGPSLPVPKRLPGWN